MSELIQLITNRWWYRGVVSFVEEAPWYLEIIAAVMFVLGLAFVVGFLGRGLFLWITLRGVSKKLRASTSGTGPDDLARFFSPRAKLKHFWHEYAETVHGQSGGGGVTWRATVPAAAYFNNENVVDAYIGAEFFRHLPGVFTGMGIIGTFAGLISGLSGFRPSTDPAETIKMLTPLVGAVHEAFFISAAAITAAMVITLLEKFSIAVLYGRIAKVADGIDRIFDAGIEEEYLERLTRATEEGTSQAKMLKDALVKDIGEILQEVSKRQAESIVTSQKELGSSLADAVQTGLKGPLDRIEQTFKTVTGGTGERTVQMLGDVMASFSAKLNDLFGKQISGINELNQRSAEAMQGAAVSLRELVDELGRKGKETTDQMARKMIEAIEAMELRQSDINNRTEATLEKVGESMRGLLNSLKDSVGKAMADSQDRETEVARRNAEVVAGFGTQVDKAIVQMSHAAQAMTHAVEALSKTTTNAIDKMNLSAERVARSTEGLAAAAAGVTGVVESARGLGKELSGHSQRLLEGARALQATLTDYQEQRHAMQQLMSEAGNMVEAARHEASITADVLRRIEQSAQGLAHVHDDFDKYLNGINGVLAKSSEAFSTAVVSTMKSVNQEFHQQLGQAVKLLASAIEELETSVSSIPSVARR